MGLYETLVYLHVVTPWVGHHPRRGDYGPQRLEPFHGKVKFTSFACRQSITNSLHGDQAIMEISRLHRNPFPLTSAAIGYYGEQEPIILWVSDTKNQNTAAMLVTDMHDAIATGNTPFSPVGEAAIDGRSVNELSGMGQRHFYFQSDSRVIWLAADPGMADEALLQVMEFYP